MASGIRTGDPRGFNKGRSSKFCEGSRARQTPEEGRRTYQLKHCGNNNKDEDCLHLYLLFLLSLFQSLEIGFVFVVEGLFFLFFLYKTARNVCPTYT